MKKTLLTVLLCLSFLSLAVVPTALALEIGEGLSDVQQEAQFGSQDLTVTIGKIIKLVLGFLGLIALILFIVGGFKWMTSGGNEESISEAKKLMSAAVVGLFIILIAYAATTFIINRLASTGVVGCVEGTFKCAIGDSDTGNTVACDAATYTWGTTPVDCNPVKYCKPDSVGSLAEICIHSSAQ